MNKKEQIAETVYKQSLQGRLENESQEREIAKSIANDVLSLLTEDKCPECGGDGLSVKKDMFDRHYAPRPCEVCHGTGKPVKECPAGCDKGRVLRGIDSSMPNSTRWEDCSVCKGKGWLPDDGLLTEKEMSYEIAMAYNGLAVKVQKAHRVIAKAQHDKDLIRFNAQDLYVLDDDQEHPHTYLSPRGFTPIPFNIRDEYNRKGFKKVKPYKREG